MGPDLQKRKIDAIVGARLVDPVIGLDEVANLFIENGVISEIGGRRPKPELRVYDASGLFLSPGFHDLHVHLREPGFEYKEDILSGSKAAAAGGFTKIYCMPNTKPAQDSPETIRLVNSRASEAALTKVSPVAAITHAISGKELADLAAFKEEGVEMISDDGRSIDDDGIMLSAMELAKELSLVVSTHPENSGITAGGVINDGPVARQLNVKGIDREAENSVIRRDIELCRKSGARLHLGHLSTSEGIDYVRMAKREGVRVTCEVTPHHIILTEEDLLHLGANGKMSPPLRTEADRLALIDGILDGTVDAIATDHAPHADFEKRDLISAPFGVIGMESAFPVCMKLVSDGLLDLKRLLELFTSGPRRVVGRPPAGLIVGISAEFTIFDPAARVVIDPERFHSKSRNSPFAGMESLGKIHATCLSDTLIELR
ncbi:MAG TPA: dihydroorotase [bacterium]|nr:dihydroorotase [bacterium]